MTLRAEPSDKVAALPAPESGRWLKAARHEVSEDLSAAARVGSLAWQGPAGIFQAGKNEFNDHPYRTIGEGLLSFGIGLALSRVTCGTRLALLMERAAAPGLVSAAVDAIPTASQSIGAFADAWRSNGNMDADRATVRKNLGAFMFAAAFNTFTGALGGKFGHAYYHPGGVWQGIPPLRKDGYLPEGLHQTTWQDFTARYGTNSHRRQQLDHMFDALHDLKEQGVWRAYVAGSFPRSKPFPGDFDIAYNILDEDVEALHSKLPVMTDRYTMKKAYGGELFSNDPYRNLQLRAFRYDTRTGKRTGAIQLDLDDLPPRISRTTPEPLADTWLQQWPAAPEGAQLS